VLWRLLPTHFRQQANNESSDVVDILLPVTFYFNPSTRLDNATNIWRLVICCPPSVTAVLLTALPPSPLFQRSLSPEQKHNPPPPPTPSPPFVRMVVRANFIGLSTQRTDQAAMRSIRCYGINLSARIWPPPTRSPSHLVDLRLATLSCVQTLPVTERLLGLTECPKITKSVFDLFYVCILKEVLGGGGVKLCFIWFG